MKTISKKLGIIGIGVMGQAILRLLLEKKIFSSRNVFIFDRDSNKLGVVAKKYKVSKLSGIEAFGKNVDFLILAVKPQNCEQVFDLLRTNLSKNIVIISIMAGISLAKMKNKLRHKKIVRVMPNMLLQIGECVSCWYADESLLNADKKIVKKILQSFGFESEVKNEDLINAATAISGSGPAYMFYILEILENAAKDLGFDSKTARSLSTQTMFGAAKIAKISDKQFSVMRKEVTSKRGTTEAALLYLQKNKFEKILKNAIKKAYARSKELGK